MNVIVSNKYQSLLANLDIDIIKSITGEFEVEDLVSQFTNFYYNKMVLDITALKNYQDIATLQKLSVNMDVSNIVILLDDSEVVNSPKYLSSLISMGIYNFTRNADSIAFLIQNPNSYKDVAQYHQLNNAFTSTTKEEEDNDSSEYNKVSLRVIGIKNVTHHAGSTTLTYLLKKELSKKYNVLAVEVDEHDFIYFNDKTLRTTSSLDLPAFIATNSDAEVILVDLNDRGSIGSCTDVIYLLEPSMIRLNKLMRRDRRIFEKLRGKKIVLCQSLLNQTDINDLEYEAKAKIFYNLPPLNDRIKNTAISDLLTKLGILSGDGSSTNSGLFNIFKGN